MVRRLLSVVCGLWLVVCGWWLPTEAHAQVIATGTTPVLEGTEYVVAFMNVSPSSTEKPLPNPLQIFISCRDTCTVQIKASGSDAPSINKEYTVYPGKMLRIPVPTPSYLTTEHGDVIGGGIRVTSSKPISVSSYIQWGGNGELSRHYPVSSWGSDYRTFNLYQDRYGMNAQYQHEPAQTLLIAAHDSTVAEIKTRYPLQYRGPDIDSIGPLTYRVRLNAYQRVLLRWHINENLNKDWSTDPTGTHITSNKPIGVLSGHTKGAIMRMPDHLPPAGQFAAPASFVRNCIQDAMLPTSTAGTEFVTVPVMYLFRTTGNDNSASGIDDDRGDVIRFIATRNNTTLWRTRQDGNGEIKAAELAEGEVYTDSAVEHAVIWRADEPVMCMQYGKSWAKVLTLAADGEDQTQALPTVESGMPMMQAVPPVSRWISSGRFYSPEGMDNFVNLVCRTADADKILLDDNVLAESPISGWRLLSGTDYGYFRFPIGAGDHVLRTSSPSARFMAWTYGSLDGLGDGRAYGAPIGVELTEPCTDTIVTRTVQNCDIFETSVTVRSGAGNCGRLHTIYALTSSNMILEKDAELGTSASTFTVRVGDITKSASAVVRVMSASGYYMDRKYDYHAPTFIVEPKVIDYGTVLFNEKRCSTIAVRNTSTTESLRLLNIGVMNHPSIFSLQPTTAVIPPNSTINVEVCAVTNTSRELLDSLVLDLGCYTMRTTELRIKGGEPTSVPEDPFSSTINPQPYRLSTGLPLTIRTRAEISSIALYDLSGRKLASSLIPSIDPAAFTGPGLYIIHVITNSGSVTLPVFCIE